MKGSKKILLVSHGFYPEISPRSFRATELATEFCRQGHDVTVLTRYRDFNYSKFLSEYRIKFKMWGNEKFPGFPRSARWPFSIINRILSRTFLTLFEYPSIESMYKVKQVLKHEEGYDLMISFAVPYPVHWGVAKSRTYKHRIADVWVADCGDPYMGDVMDSFRKPFYFGYLERYFCTKADYISVPMENAKQGYYSQFHSKIRVIPQGFKFDQRPLNGTKVSKAIPTFAYAGIFIARTRDPRPFLTMLSKITKPFKFIVYTSTPEFLEKFKTQLGERLTVSNYIPREELIVLLRTMDFLVNFDNNTPLNLPSKLIDYAITNRPVLNVDKDFQSEDLLAFLNGDYSNRMDLPSPSYYHIERVSRLFTDLIKS